MTVSRLFVTSLVLATVGVSPALGQSGEAFYQGRQITIYVAAGAGGPFGLRANLLVNLLGKHLPGRQDIRYIVVSDHQESRNIDDEPHTLAYETLNRNAGWPRFRERIGRLRPMSQYNRVQIIGDMPEELIRLCWWCRTPRDGQPCHRCATCRVVDPALDANGIVLN